MERLTEYTRFHGSMLPVLNNGDRHAAIERLALIEDILGDNYDLSRLRELVQADREGRYIVMKYAEREGVERLKHLADADRENRCVVLSCRVGDTVKIDAKTWGNIWNFKTVEYGKFLIGEIVAIIKTKKQTLIKIRAKHNVEWKRPTKRYPMSAIGKTVFLIHESAEATLKERGSGE